MKPTRETHPYQLPAQPSIEKEELRARIDENLRKMKAFGAELKTLIAAYPTVKEYGKIMGAYEDDGCVTKVQFDRFEELKNRPEVRTASLIGFEFYRLNHVGEYLEEIYIMFYGPCVWEAETE